MNCIGKKSKLNAPRKGCMKICFSFRCNSYGLWTPTKCDSILIFTSLTTKFVAILLTLTTKMSYLSDFKRTKSKTLRTAKQTEDELNKAAVWSSANITNKRLAFLKFDYRKYSNFLLLYKSTLSRWYGVKQQPNLTNLHAIYVWNGHGERCSSHWYLQLHTRIGRTI